MFPKPPFLVYKFHILRFKYKQIILRLNKIKQLFRTQLKFLIKKKLRESTVINCVIFSYHIKSYKSPNILSLSDISILGIFIKKIWLDYIQLMYFTDKYVELVFLKFCSVFSNNLLRQQRARLSMVSIGGP